MRTPEPSSPDRESNPDGSGGPGTRGVRGDGPRPARVLLVDCDMFYVQVARLEDPDGAGREELLIVGGSPSGRGVVTSASYPVRAFGVRSGMPTSQALRLCPMARVVPVSRRACSARSRQVKRILDVMAPVVQAASIDEFYLDLSGTERLLHRETLQDTAWRIRERVLDEIGISVSVGGGVRKLIAKLAAGRAKPGGVQVISPGEEEEFLRTFRLREIPGVGPVLAKALESKGLVMVTDLLAVDPSWLERWLGSTRARWLWRRARGLDSSAVIPREPRKSVSSERTFGSDLRDDRELEKELLRMAGTVGRSLRKQGFRGRTITVKIRDQDFKIRTASHTLADPVESDSILFSVSRCLLEELRATRRTGVRLLGVGISSLVEQGAPSQLGLFGEEIPSEPERLRTLSQMVDDLRNRFGEDAILPGRMLERAGGKDVEG
jgi:DNA polymerase-4